MQRTAHAINTQLADVWRHTLSSATQLALAILCGLLLMSGALAQEQRPEPLPTPEPATPEGAAMPKVPDPNEALTPVPLANQTVDGDIVFTSPGQFTYPRDIRLSDNFGGLRFFGANQLTTSPAGAAIQFFGNNAAPYPGQLYLDSGAHDFAALIFRTAMTGGTIAERMRVTSDGRVGIGTDNPSSGTLRVVGNGTQNAVVSETSAENGYSVLSYAYGRGGYGVRGYATGSNGIGVEGRATGSGSVGVSGISTSSNGTGVYGQSSGANGWAGRFSGDVQVAGTLVKSSGSFKIDHPLDPTNKYLSHSFVESPDMMNIYNGNVTTDARGRAVVTLPDYFAALNRDYRYQLTVVGRFAQAIVASEVKQNRFTIKTNKPGVKVSWQVTGVRQDAYAEQHRIPVEEDKPAEERGTYLNPEAFNQPAEKGAAHARQPTAGQQPRAEMSGGTTATKPTASVQR